MPLVYLQQLDREGLAWAQQTVTVHHYLRRPVDVRTMPEGYKVMLRVPSIRASQRVGLLLFGRPECTRCTGFFGSIEDVQAVRGMVTRWQVLNLSRVWLSPEVQPGGRFHSPDYLPGFTDRHGVWRSTLASVVIAEAARRIRLDYLLARPPCYLDEPYQLLWLISYCDTSQHRGTIYAAAGFSEFRRNARGIATWRLPLAPLLPEADAMVRAAASVNPRSRRFRERRAQLALELIPGTE